MATKKLDSAAAFLARMRDFIKLSEENGNPPTDHALLAYMGLKPSELRLIEGGKDKYGTEYTNPDDKKTIRDALDLLTAYREDRLVRQLETGRQSAPNAIFQLKQPKNGGYVDAQQQDTTAAVTIKIEGIGGLESFK